MSASWLATFAVVLVALGADAANVLVIASRRGGRVWALMTVAAWGGLAFTVGWLWLMFAEPARYDHIPAPLLFVLASRTVQSLALWRLSYRVLAGNR